MIEYLAIIISVIALILESPTITRFLIYFMYKPKLDIFFQPPNGRSEILADPEYLAPLEIRNKDAKREVQIELELVASKPVVWRIFPQYLANETYMPRGRSKGSGFEFRRNTFLLSGGGQEVKGFPFEPYPEEYTLEITAYAKMRMSEFHLPAFFGELNLKSVKKTFTVKPWVKKSSA